MERSIVTLGMLIRRASSAPAGIEFKLRLRANGRMSSRVVGVGVKRVQSP